MDQNVRFPLPLVYENKDLSWAFIILMKEMGLLATRKVLTMNCDILHS